MSTYCAPTYDRSKQEWEAYFRRRDLSKLPHAQKYPELLKFWEEPRQYPDTNVYERNLIYNPTLPLLKQLGQAQMQGGALIDAGGVLHKRDNWVAEADPGFVDAAGGNFALKPNAAAFHSHTGLQGHSLR